MPGRAGPGPSPTNDQGGEPSMENEMMFFDCPAYLDKTGASRCGLPAEVQYRYIQGSTDGPLESAKIKCPSGHWFNGPVEFLTWRKPQDTARASGTVPAARHLNSGPGAAAES